MKKSQMVRKMMKIIKTWEDCKLETKLAHQLLDMMEEEGMTPPATGKDFLLLGSGEVIENARIWENEK